MILYRDEYRSYNIEIGGSATSAGLVWGARIWRGDDHHSVLNGKSLNGNRQTTTLHRYGSDKDEPLEHHPYERKEGLISMALPHIHTYIDQLLAAQGEPKGDQTNART